MTWSAQQDGALRAIKKWLAEPRGPQVFRLFGYAGTGKTTLAKAIAEDVPGEVLYMAFTGKAALVLRMKGCTGASTIHSAIYKPMTDEITGITTFELNRDSAVATAALVIVDEVSMVGEDLAADLLGFGAKVLVLGDPAQLPPVKGEGYFINAKPDYMLTEVHRQAEDNPIIRMSMDVRQGVRLAPGRYGESEVLHRHSMSQEALRERVLAADQLLCGTNRTRHAFNRRCRELQGKAGILAAWHPVVGDRLVCLRNDSTKGLLNGSLWEVMDTNYKLQRPKQTGHFKMTVQSLDIAGLAGIEVQTLEQFFTGTEAELDWRDKRDTDQFTYGYALTVHKSQGSQWDNVLVYDESTIFREDSAKHLYTAITRAAERVTVILTS